MNDVVLRYVYELAPDARARVTKYFSAEVEEFSILLSKLVGTLQNYHMTHRVPDEHDPKQSAFELMTKGANTLMAAFELALGGYMWEPPMIFRSALEGFAAAWDIAHNNERFAIWKTKRQFDSTDSITNLKKAIDPVGKMYGFLSNMYVHANQLNSAPSVFRSGEAFTFQLFGLIPIGKERVRKSEVYFSLLTAFVCLQLTELVFHQYAHGLETIERVPGTDDVRTITSERHRRFVEEAMRHFAAIADDPSIAL